MRIMYLILVGLLFAPMVAKAQKVEKVDDDNVRITKEVIEVINIEDLNKQLFIEQQGRQSTTDSCANTLADYDAKIASLEKQIADAAALGVTDD